MTKKEPKPSTVNTELIVYRLDEIKAELASFKREYVTKAESAELRSEIAQLRTEVHEMKRRGNVTNWLYPTASAVFTALFTFLILRFFQNYK